MYKKVSRGKLWRICVERRGPVDYSYQPLKAVETLFVYHVVVRTGPLAPYIVLETYYIEMWRLEVLTRHYKLTLSLASGFEYSAQHFLSFNFQDDPKDIVSSVCVVLLLS